MKNCFAFRLLKCFLSGNKRHATPRKRSRLHSCVGSLAAESAGALALLLGFTGGILDMGVGEYYQHIAENAANRGARAGIVSRNFHHGPKSLYMVATNALWAEIPSFKMFENINSTVGPLHILEGTDNLVLPVTVRGTYSPKFSILALWGDMNIVATSVKNYSAGPIPPNYFLTDVNLSSNSGGHMVSAGSVDASSFRRASFESSSSGEPTFGARVALQAGIPLVETSPLNRSLVANSGSCSACDAATQRSYSGLGTIGTDTIDTFSFGADGEESFGARAVVDSRFPQTSIANTNNGSCSTSCWSGTDTGGQQPTANSYSPPDEPVCEAEDNYHCPAITNCTSPGGRKGICEEHYDNIADELTVVVTEDAPNVTYRDGLALDSGCYPAAPEGHPYSCEGHTDIGEDELADYFDILSRSRSSMYRTLELTNRDTGELESPLDQRNDADEVAEEYNNKIGELASLESL